MMLLPSQIGPQSSLTWTLVRPLPEIGQASPTRSPPASGLRPWRRRRARGRTWPRRSAWLATPSAAPATCPSSVRPPARTRTTGMKKTPKTAPFTPCRSNFFLKTGSREFTLNKPCASTASSVLPFRSPPSFRRKEPRLTRCSGKSTRIS